ncbi:MAG: type IVB secretion system protein IcmV [Legionella sp.]|uniref:type IVB secretion system protein IcmV n=1 Tax=Legionella sp. TaxID=459 RepID=UPI0039E5FA96
MKKHSNSKIVKLLGSILNVRAWFDWERVRAFTLYLVNGFKRLFVPQKNFKAQSFKEASTKLNLNDENLHIKQNALLRLSIIMLIAAFIIFSYAGYQLMYGSFKAMIVSLIVTLIALTLAFRYHFWYYQIKQRKLGCSFNEWFRQGLLGEKK